MFRWIALLLLVLVPKTEVLGVPCSDQGWYARNVWDMITFDGRVFVGCGNSSNNAPSANAGPIDIWSYGDDTGWVREFTVDEEQIDHFVILNNVLTIPGHDPHQTSKLANWYSRNEDGTWTKHRNIPAAEHVYDLTVFHGTWFAALGARPPSRLAAAISTDSGNNWTDQPIAAVSDGSVDPPCAGKLYSAIRTWAWFTIGDTLYGSTGGYLASGCLGESPTDGLEMIAQWDGSKFVPTHLELFPGFPDASRVVRPVVYGQQTVYIGATPVNDHQWIPVGLFQVDVNLHPQAISLDQCARVQDIEVDNNILYVLCNQPEASGWRISVQATCDLTRWTEADDFEAKSFARSFTLNGATFYFGLGGDQDAAQATQDSIGEVLRRQPDALPTC